MPDLIADPHNLPRPDTSGAQIRDQAMRILSGAQFRRPPRSPVQIATEWIGRQIDRLLNLTGGSEWLALALVVVAVVASTVIVIRFTRGMRRDPGTGVTLHDDVGRSSVDWRAEAAAHEAAGRWRDALRCRYRAVVADLAARGVVEEVPGRTTGEYRAQVAHNLPAGADAFSGVTDLFERAWYGAAETGPDESGRVRDLSDRVLTGAGR